MHAQKVILKSTGDIEPLMDPSGVLNTVSIELYRASGCVLGIAVLDL